MKPSSSLPQLAAEALAMEYRNMDADACTQAEQMVTHFFAGNGKLWALNQYCGRFGQVNSDGVDGTRLLNLAGLNQAPNDEEDCLFPGFVSENHLFDKSGALKPNAVFPQAKNRFYDLCQPLGAQKVIAAEAFGAAVLDLSKSESRFIKPG